MGKEVRKGDFLKTASFAKQEPGRYEIKGFTNDMYVGVPNQKFGLDKKLKDIKGQTPGPGNYEENRTIGTMGVPQYSMPGRRKDYVSIERQRLGVGVPEGGIYNPNDKSSKKNGYSYSVKKARRDGELGIFKNTPGSGAYHPDASLKIVKTASASWSMGSSKRPKQQHYVPPTPGPGQYEMRKTPGAEMPGYSINKRPTQFYK